MTREAPGSTGKKTSVYMAALPIIKIGFAYKSYGMYMFLIKGIIVKWRLEIV